ncbi:MAG: amidohydrolase [Bacillota bacterium]
MRIYKGSILTCDKEDNVYRYLIEKEGKILFVGNTLPDYAKDKKIIDMKNNALIPTFADTHSHFASYAVLANALFVDKATSVDEIKNMLKKADKEMKSNKTLIAFGLNPTKLKEKRLVNKQDIDEVAKDRNVIIITADGHSVVINTKVLDKLPKKIQTIRGYDFESGIIKHEAFYEVVDFLPKLLKKSDILKYMQNAIDTLISKGIGLVDAASGTGFPGDLDVDLIKWIARGQQNGFQMRIFFQTFDVTKVKKRGFTRLGGCFKAALDGSIGSGDAALNEPYNNKEDKGILFYSDEEVYENFKAAHLDNLQISVHAIGDAAFDQATRTLKRVLDENPKKDHRHGIIHASLPTEEGLKICRDYDIQIFAQFSFIDVSGALFDPMYKALGDRVYAAEPYRKMVDYGIKVSAGSDAPVTMPDPILWLYNACNNPNEKNRLTIKEALKICTYNGYFATFDEKQRGSLEKGKWADMVMLSQNPYSVKVNNLNTLKVLKTYLKGKAYAPENNNTLKTLIKGILSKDKC